MTGALREGVKAAIENLRPSFEADNFEVALESLSEAGDVVIAIEAGPSACLDCLVPDPMLKQIVDAAVRRYAPEVTSVAVVKRGFATEVSPERGGPR
jgi:Fe-S cluster biogenesis protein NfuA